MGKSAVPDGGKKGFSNKGNDETQTFFEIR
jgi:hypothetical protein